MSTDFTPSQQRSFAEPLQRPKQLEPHGASPLFSVLTDLLQVIADLSSGTSSRGKSDYDRKRRCLEVFFKQWREKVGNDLFPVIRLLVPERDRERPMYGLKEQALARGYVSALSLSQQTSAAQTLLKWRQPSGQEKGKGDFALTAYEIIKSRSVVSKASMTIDDINTRLDELARLSGDAKSTILREFYDKLTPEDQKWLIRIILKDLKISIRERTVLNVLHADAIDLFNVCSDLQRVCYTLYSPSISLPREDSVVGIFKAFRPMLCKRNERDLKHIVKLMTQAGGPENKKQETFFIEEKLDGERIQLHKRGEEYRYWSRKDKEYTYLYGQTRAEGSLTPWIDQSFHANIEEIILDGEMLVWDPQTNKTQSFGSLKTAALNPTDDSSKPRPLFRVFDVLYVKGRHQPGQSLIYKPLFKRKEAMRRFFEEVPGRLEFAYEQVGQTSEDIRQALEKVLEERGEGLVVKRRDSHYILNGREDTWVKVKPDYMDELGEVMDLTVVGGNWGRGRRTGRFASFLCALFDSSAQNADVNAPDARYLTFCKVGSGFSFSDLSEIMAQTANKWIPWDRQKPDKNPEWLILGDVQPEVPDCWIHPHDSFVITVKAAEITGGSSYGANMCLRFPRCIRWDREKTYADGMSMEEYWKLQEDQKSNKKRVGEDLSGHTARQKRKVNSRKATIAAAFRGANVGDVEVKDAIFNGITFYILEGLNDQEGKRTRDLERLVYEHGGDYVQTIPLAERRMIISPRSNFHQAKNVIKRDNDIIHPSWLFDSIARGYALPISEEYFVHASDATRTTASFKQNVNQPNNTGAGGRFREVDSEDTESEEDTAPPSTGLRDSSESSSGSETESEEEVEPRYVVESILEGELSVDGPKGFDSPEHTASDFDAPPGLGAGTDQIEYDSEGFFAPLVFYLDTRENGERNGLTVTEDTLTADNSYFAKAVKLLKAHGATITEELMDTNLTHIVASDADPSRCIEMMRKTSKPRRRRLVTPDWIFDSVTEGALANEADYIPAF